MQLFSAPIATTNWYIIKYYLNLRFVWSFCLRHCHRQNIEHLDSTNWLSQGFQSNIDEYLGVTFEYIRKRHKYLNRNIQGIVYETTLGRRCDSFRKYLKIIASSLIVSHVCNVSILFNPIGLFVQECVKFYRSARRLKLEFEVEKWHHKPLCPGCKFYFFKYLSYFWDGLCHYPTLNTRHRIFILYTDLLQLWSECNVNCISYFKNEILDENNNCINFYHIHPCSSDLYKDVNKCK